MSIMQCLVHIQVRCYWVSIKVGVEGEFSETKTKFFLKILEMSRWKIIEKTFFDPPTTPFGGRERVDS